VIVKDIARVDIGFLPTPLEPALRLSRELGVEMMLKRDDFTGFGGGGNKVRKLEYLVAEAAASGANVLITTGGLQSNHARMTAAVARRFGMSAVLVLRGNRPPVAQGNLLLDHLFGAEIEFLDPDQYFAQIDDRMQAHADAATARGLKPYIIPLGGASPLGALGYVRAVGELASQYAQLGLPAPDYVVAAIGTGGTLAGLHVGASRLWPSTKVFGVCVARDSAWFDTRVAGMATEAADLAGLGGSWTAADIWTDDQHIGPGYGVPSDGAVDAIRRLARTEGVLLDPVYTGKAMAGLLTAIERGDIPSGSRVLFIHTGGSPALYPFAEALTAE